MKVLFIFLFIAFFGLQNASAQISEAAIEAALYEPWVPVRTTGIKGGVSVASISNLANSSAFLGFHAGFFGEVQTGEEFGYGGEITYSKQGVTISNVDYGLSYLDIPLFLNLYYDNVTFQGGGYGGALFMATAKAGQEKKDVTDYFLGTDYGLLLGLKFKPGGQTFVGVRYNLGMQNINNNFAERSGAVLKNRNIQISAGYQF